MLKYFLELIISDFQMAGTSSVFNFCRVKLEQYLNMRFNNVRK